MIKIKNFPVPPSVNKYLMPIKGRMIKTPQHRAYEQECLMWRLKNQTLVNEAKILFKDLEFKESILVLRVEIEIFINKSKLLTKQNRPKKIDTDNFQKPLIDNLFKLLEIDDKYIFASTIEKIPIKDELKPVANILISHHKIKEIEP